jgi:putative addiction module antidote
MNKPLKLIKIGNSTGVILPKEILARLRVEQGDSLFLTEAPGGAFRVTGSNPNFERQMAAAEEIMKEDRDILRVLSK